MDDSTPASSYLSSKAGPTAHIEEPGALTDPGFPQYLVGLGPPSGLEQVSPVLGPGPPTLVDLLPTHVGSPFKFQTGRH